MEEQFLSLRLTSYPSSIIVNPFFRGGEKQAGDGSYNDKQHPGQRGGIAHFELRKRLDIEIEGIKKG